MEEEEEDKEEEEEEKVVEAEVVEEEEDGLMERWGRRCLEEMNEKGAMNVNNLLRCWIQSISGGSSP